ncbi:MAG: hypothetical protein IPM59_08125 [Chloracidobacterium sp.]|nr:hypothetical protein [Chloracidobacterium sp.]
MFGKIYLGILAVSMALMAFFTCYSCSWLKSVGAPAAAMAGYEYHSTYGWTALWLTTAVLLLLGNAVFWAGGRAWALWLSAIYFAIFSILRSFWLEPAAAEFRTANGLSSGDGIGPIFAAVLIVVVFVVAFVDQFVLVRLRKLTFPPAAETEQATPEGPTDNADEA